MKRDGIYMNVISGEIILAVGVEHYEKSITTDDGGGFSIVKSGQWGKLREIRRLLVLERQFKFFKWIGVL